MADIYKEELDRALAALRAFNQAFRETNQEVEQLMAKNAQDEKFLTRITVDLVTDEPLSERRQQTMARELTDNLHVLVVEDEDQPLKEVNKFVSAHTHDTADGNRCQVCVEQSLDYRNGSNVAAGDF